MDESGEPSASPEASPVAPEPPPHDPIKGFFQAPTARRALLGVLFLALLWLLRHQLPTLAAFAVSQRFLAWTGEAVARRTGWSFGRSALLVAIGCLTAVVGGAWLGGQWAAGAWAQVQGDIPGLISTLRANPVVEQVLERLGESDWAGTGFEAATHAVEWLREAGVLVLDVAVGFTLAVIHAFERDELDAMIASLDPRSILATLVRWTDHVGDGLAITVQLQLVVAACNATLTLPVLMLLGMPYIPALAALIFVGALVPVVGNIVSGAVLAAVAWPDHGWIGVSVFAATTFALGKIEGFYLNPRLASRHVRLPGFVLTVSLVLWETVFGFVGFFLSFPFLYVCGRIQQEVNDELV